MRAEQPEGGAAGEISAGNVRSAPGRGARRALAVLLVAPSVWLALEGARLLDGLTFQPTPVDWPVVPVLLSAVWLVVRGPRDFIARSRDSLLRIARSGGVALIFAAEVWALGKIARYADPTPAHLLAALAFSVAVLAALTLELRAAWLRRVRAGRISGFRIRRLPRSEQIAESFVPVAAFEPCDVLVRLSVTPGSYRGGVVEVPVARVPRRFWRMRAGTHWVL